MSVPLGQPDRSGAILLMRYTPLSSIFSCIVVFRQSVFSILSFLNPFLAMTQSPTLNLSSEHPEIISTDAAATTIAATIREMLSTVLSLSLCQFCFAIWTDAYASVGASTNTAQIAEKMTLSFVALAD
jgi:hypothetical protein